MIRAKTSQQVKREHTMRSLESTEGGYRIYASALKAPGGRGYVAAVVVKRINGDMATAREAFRHESLAGGHRWPSPEAARLMAMAMAQQVIRHEPHRLKG
jgi:hypothetical protein